MVTETEYPEYIEGFALSGLEVKNAKEQSFEIINEPCYELSEFDGKPKRRLCFEILFNKTSLKYYPNMTSQGKIIGSRGRRLKDWIGFKGEFEVIKSKINGENHEVIYIK